LYALEGLKRYNGLHPLENFLWVHVHNQLYNFKRKYCGRPNLPCLNCPLNAYRDGSCTLYDSENHCDIYMRWANRNQKKRHLLSTTEHYDTEDGGHGLSIEVKEIYEIVDKQIPTYMREDWIRLVNGIKISKNKKASLLETIRTILGEYHVE